MDVKKMKQISKELHKASKMHKGQAKKIDSMLRNSPLPGLISPLKAKAKGIDGKACWKGYTLKGTKMKGGKRVDNCVKN
jgi:hypothetical protein